MAVAGCGSPPSTPDAAQEDSGNPPSDGGDRCEGLTLCDAAGTSCDGDELVTCAANADGCLVETREDCGAGGEVCDASGATAECVDPCADIAAADQCDTEGARACATDSLEVCTMRADGCLFLERTDCAASPGGVCDETGAMPMCVLPPDPCEAIPAADRCTTEGTSCDGDELVDCAPNAFGCLVTTRTDCTARAGGTCDASGTAAVCAATDPCDGITECAAAGTSCDGPELVTCAADAFGCLVETRTDCTDTMFGFCDDAASPAAMCSTAAVDPCMGVTECGTAASRACGDRTTLDVCAPNAFGCFVETSTDCAATSQVCDDTSGTAICVDPCSLVTVCPAATYCAGDELVTCAANADGCLVESTRMECTDTCDPSGTAACVTTSCPEAIGGFLSCTSGTVMGDTSTGVALNDGDYPGCYTGTSYTGNEQYWRFRNDATTRMAVRVVSTRGTSTSDFDLFVLDAGDGSATCTSGTLSCLDSGRGTSATETVDFIADPGDLSYVVYDIYSSTTATTDYTLTVTCEPIVCGDSLVTADEECDDGGTTDGDGCSATCESEPGWECTGAPSTCTFVCGDGTLDTGAGEQCDDGGTTAGDGCSASCQVETGYTCVGTGAGSCVAQAANATCAGALPLGSGVTGADLRTGGARPTGTSCGSSAGPVLYYTVDVPAMSVTTVTGTPTGSSWDLTLRSLADCSGACILHRDGSSSGSAENIVLTNTTASPQTYYVAVGADSTSTLGTFDLSSSTTALAPNATCAGATSITGTTTITGESIGLGASRPTGTSCGFGSGDNTLYYSVSVPAGGTVEVTTAGTFDRVLMVEDACGASACSYVTDSSPERATLTNTGTSDITQIVAIRNYSAGVTGTFDITFTYITPAANATCASATSVTTSQVIPGALLASGGAPPTGSMCGGGTGSTALYYSVQVPAGTTADIFAASSTDIVLFELNACGDTDCTRSVDLTASAGERITIDNTAGASPITRIVGVRGYSATSGTVDLAFAYRRVEPITAACVTTGTWTSLTRSSMTSDDATTPITALPFAFRHFGQPVTHFSTSTNGFAQLWTSSSGSPLSSFSNSSLPSSSTPNGTVAAFWDDLYLGASFDIRTQVIGAAGSQVFVIEWQDALAGSGGDPLTFQAHFYETTNTIELHYCSVGASTRASGDSATIGAENTTGRLGFNISYNMPGAVSTGAGYRISQP